MGDLEDIRHMLGALGPQHRYVLKHAAAGIRRSETANRMGVSVASVRRRRKEATRILGARTLTHAVAIAIRTGYLR